MRRATVAKKGAEARLLKVLVIPLAQADLRGIRAYLDAQSDPPALSERFLSSFEKTCLTISHYPQIGRSEALVSSSARAQVNLRRLPVDRFPRYLVLYTVQQDTIFITRVLHSARDPQLRTDPS